MQLHRFNSFLNRYDELFSVSVYHYCMFATSGHMGLFLLLGVILIVLKGWMHIFILHMKLLL